MEGDLLPALDRDQIHYSEEFFIILYAVTATAATTTSTEYTGCASGLHNYIADGYCDDQNNVEECQWDGGDCCLDTVLTDYCDDCACLDPGAGDSGTTTAGNKGEGMQSDYFYLSTWSCS